MSASFGPFRLGHFTHRGPRETNQDTVLSIKVSQDRWLMAVADGMGGLEEGELASKTALSALFQNLSDGVAPERAVQAAHEAVRRASKGADTGTTLVAAVLSGKRASILNVGDSRAYCSDSLGLIQVTRDHTLAEEAVESGSIPLDGLEENSSPWAGALARYLGKDGEVNPEAFGPLDLVEGGWLLLCSDGLHRVMSLDEIDAFLAGQTDARDAAVALVEEALKRGTQDNVSVVLAHWPDESEDEPGPGPFEPWISERPATTRSERVLIRPRSSAPSRRRWGRMALIFLVVAASMAILVFLVNWFLSSGP